MTFDDRKEVWFPDFVMYYKEIIHVTAPRNLRACHLQWALRESSKRHLQCFFCMPCFEIVQILNLLESKLITTNLHLSKNMTCYCGCHHDVAIVIIHIPTTESIV
jgi:hypothetical protein